MEKIRIPEYYKGKDVFITGGTGFLGKALIEKLLRSCPDIGDIYILMRPKRGKHLQERLKVLLDQAVFERLKSERPGQLEKKLKVLAGDVSQLNLGLSEEDRQTVVDNVSIIFHVAASVRFDDPMREAILMNVRGSREAAQLALDCKRLSVLIHVSTAFTNCDRTAADEVIYPEKLPWGRAIELAERADPALLVTLTAKLLDTMPNTYTFTKHIAEHAVRDMCAGKIPVKIVRPSIVISSLNEPVKGWIDNFNGPVGILTAYGKGIMRTTYAKVENKPDYIPVDIVTKAIVVAAWDLGIRQDRTCAEVIHCSSHEIAWSRPTIAMLAVSAAPLTRDLPFNDVVWVTSDQTSTRPVTCYLRTLLYQLLPALLMDLGLRLSGRKPFLTKIQRKIYSASLALRHFVINEWSYSNWGFLELRKAVLPEDREDFDYDFAEGDFVDFLRHSIIGCRRYLLNEPDDTLPAARRHYNRMIWVDRISKVLFYVFLVWLVYKLDLVTSVASRLPTIFGLRVPTA